MEDVLEVAPAQAANNVGSMVASELFMVVVEVMAGEERLRSWMKWGACADTKNPDMFFPELGYSAVAAKAVCHFCDVKQYYLDYALDNNEKFGIWGEMTAKERRRLPHIRSSKL